MLIDVDGPTPVASLASASSKGDLKTCNSCRPGETHLRRPGAPLLWCWSHLGEPLESSGSSISENYRFDWNSIHWNQRSPFLILWRSLRIISYYRFYIIVDFTRKSIKSREFFKNTPLCQTEGAVWSLTPTDDASTWDWTRRCPIACDQVRDAHATSWQSDEIWWCWSHI